MEDKGALDVFYGNKIMLLLRNFFPDSFIIKD